jgi:hypothetical protein
VEPLYACNVLADTSLVGISGGESRQAGTTSLVTRLSVGQSG